MQTTVQQWGNSLAVRIPGAVARDIRLSPGVVVDIVAVAGKIVVKPSRRRSYTLAQLLKGVTATNRHAEADWGKPIGREAW